MTQIIPVGKGILIAHGERVSLDQYQAMVEKWRETFPDVPMLLVQGELKLLPEGELPAVFEFTGEVTPTVVAEFQRWWKEVNRG